MLATEEISFDLNGGGPISRQKGQVSLNASFDIPSQQLQNNGK